MKMRIMVLIFCAATMVYAKSAITIATLTDGSSAQNEAARSLLIDEITKLTKGEFAVSFPKAKQLDGQYSSERISASLNRLQNDPEVDIVITSGVISSQLAIKSASLKKPTFAPFAFNAPLAKNKSAKTNLNFVTNESKLQDEIESFQKVVSFDNVAVLIDDSLYESLATKTSKFKGAPPTFIVSLTPNEDLVAKIPTNVRAVIIAPLPRLDAAAKKKLSDKLIERKLPSYALSGDITAQDGFLVSFAASGDLSRRVRRAALNIVAVLRGEKIDEQPILFDEKKESVINMATARAIGVYPKLEAIKRAALLHAEAEEIAPKLTLMDAAKEAISANLSVIASKLGVEASRENIAEARSVLFPQITGELSYTQMNADNVYVKNGFYAEKSSGGAFKLQQLLFSQKALANLDIQKSLQVGIEERQKALEIEVVRATTTAFLNFLLAQTNHNIAKENLKLTQTNLELAKRRLKSGATDKADVYYWESAIATSSQSVLHMDSEAKKAKETLRVILNRKINDRFSVEPTALNDQNIISGKLLAQNVITSQKEYDAMCDFFIKEAFANSPQLARLRAELLAQERRAESDKAAYWTPQIALIGETSHTFDETRSGASGIDLKGKTNWQATVALTLPIYEGGAADARYSRSKIQLYRQQVGYQDAKASIEQNVRKDLFSISASYPSIALSAEAAESAKKTLLLTQANYAEGTRTLSDLLTMQNASLIADQSAANAVYRFMIDLMSLQQDIGTIDVFLDERSHNNLINKLMLYIASSGKKEE